MYLFTNNSITQRNHTCRSDACEVRYKVHRKYRYMYMYVYLPLCGTITFTGRNCLQGMLIDASNTCADDIIYPKSKGFVLQFDKILNEYR